ncbi:hypothetical protein PF008_g10149 [Phytophthora fragariae]|uniref:Uncharacterized protein n=1 Tax=Phytophthora fragariae TaxID=53985 RepID=A0A6G0RUR5_9STRA|nr:hypothetical protein PF008_g10149 [Phytophthora fragariae]
MHGNSAPPIPATATPRPSRALSMGVAYPYNCEKAKVRTRPRYDCSKTHLRTCMMDKKTNDATPKRACMNAPPAFTKCARTATGDSSSKPLTTPASPVHPRTTEPATGESTIEPATGGSTSEPLKTPYLRKSSISTKKASKKPGDNKYAQHMQRLQRAAKTDEETWRAL